MVLEVTGGILARAAPSAAQPLAGRIEKLQAASGEVSLRFGARDRPRGFPGPAPAIGIVRRVGRRRRGSRASWPRDRSLALIETKPPPRPGNSVGCIETKILL